jgi:hypothetical protein
VNLRFSPAEITHWADLYSYSRPDRHRTERLRPAALLQRHISRDQLLQVCRWKSPRAAPKAELNDDPYVKEITAISFCARNERVRIEVLTLLSGVSWPIASTILHFCVSADYPILDVRALWSLGVDKPSCYRFQRWDQYAKSCRQIALEAGVSIRTLDKALWQFAKIHQPKLSED